MKNVEHKCWNWFWLLKTQFTNNWRNLASKHWFGRTPLEVCVLCTKSYYAIVTLLKLIWQNTIHQLYWQVNESALFVSRPPSVSHDIKAKVSCFFQLEFRFKNLDRIIYFWRLSNLSGKFWGYLGNFEFIANTIFFKTVSMSLE